MGSVKLKDLKAFVRYDGSGRVVSGSLIFRKKKPKNGRWVEIPKNLCCNDNPSSTTTTTTQGGGEASTAWVTYVAGNQENACAQTGGWSFVLYTAESTLGAGVVLYTDAALTTEFNSYQYASILYNDGTLYQLSDLPGNGTIVNVMGGCPPISTTTTTTLPVYLYDVLAQTVPMDPCLDAAISVPTSGDLLGNLYADYTSYGFFAFQSIWIRYVDLMGNTKYVGHQINYGGQSSTYVDGPFSC